MLISEYVEILEKSGSAFSKVGEYYFRPYGWKNYSFPPCARININKKLILHLKWKFPVSVLLTDFPKKNTYEFILDTDDYCIDKFPRKTRNRIRKSLQNCSFKRPEIDDLFNAGLELNRQTCKRQNRKEKQITETEFWRKMVNSLYYNDEIIILGAYYMGNMVGYLVVVKLNNKYSIQYAFVDRHNSEFASPMNGLIFTLVNDLIKKESRIKLSYGLDSFNPLPELNRFKLKMLFKKIPVTRVYLINPHLLPFIKIIVYIQISLLKRKKFTNPFLRELVYIYYGHRLLSRELRTGNLS